MEGDRKEFLKVAGLSGFGMVGTGIFAGCGKNISREKKEVVNWQSDPEWQKIKYGDWGGPGVDPRPGEMDEILLKDYAPKTSIVVPETFVGKAKYPVIDVHLHDYPGRASGDTKQTLTDWVKTMDEVGVEMSVILSSATGQRFDEIADFYLGSYPERFQVYCGLKADNIDAPDYPKKAAEELERCYEKGARGIGELTDKGLGFTNDPELNEKQRLHPDDSRLDEFWQKCAELNLPVNLHIADHPSAWEPLNVFQERTPDYQHFNLHSDDIPSHSELLVRRDRLLKNHPDTRFIACHLSNQGHDLASLAITLDEYSNLYLDISARDYEVGRTPRAAQRFLKKYSDRVLFGTDMGMQKSMYQAWWRLLETDDEYVTGRVWWPYYGLDLSDDILKAIYVDNANSLMNWEPV